MIIRNALVAGEPDLKDIILEGGLIKEITPAGKMKPSADELDAGSRHVIPGMIDPHVHMRCPGMEQKEDWTSGSLAALSGGVTTVFDMPNTKPATETMQALSLKREVAAKAFSTDTKPSRYFWAGCSPENIGELELLLDEDDVVGVKLFFSESSANKSSGDISFISRVFSTAAEAGKPAAVHSELAALLSGIDPADGNTGNILAGHNLARPAGAAVAGTALALELAAVAGCRLYLCHLSTMPEFAMVSRHKQAYGRDSVIAELTPHHLLLNENHKVSGGMQSWAKVNPPLRCEEDRKAAAEALLDGTIDCIGSDHAPHMPAEKNESVKDFAACPSGFPGLETELGFIAGFLKEHESDWIKKLSMLTNLRAAEIFGLSDRNRIAEGKCADLVILGGPGRVHASSFKTKAKYSPFNGMEMPVTVYKTIAGGKVIG